MSGLSFHRPRRRERALFHAYFQVIFRADNISAFALDCLAVMDSIILDYPAFPAAQNPSFADFPVFKQLAFTFTAFDG